MRCECELGLLDGDVAVGDGGAGAHSFAFAVRVSRADVHGLAGFDRGCAGMADAHAASVGQLNTARFGGFEDRGGSVAIGLRECTTIGVGGCWVASAGCRRAVRFSGCLLYTSPSPRDRG